MAGAPLRLALAALSRAAPRGLAWSELFDELETLTGAPLDPTLRDGVMANMVQLYFQGVVGLHQREPVQALEVHERPRVARLNRWLAAEGAPWVVDPWHRPVTLTPRVRALLATLDGETPLDQLRERYADADDTLRTLARRGLLEA